MFESYIIFAFSLTFGLMSYKLHLGCKIPKQEIAQAKIAKPIYDFKGQLLRDKFY